MLFAVTFVVFNRVGELRRAECSDYAVYLLTTIVLWTFFAEATNGGLTSLTRSESLLRKLRFPRLALPLSAMLKALFNLAMNIDRRAGAGGGDRGSRPRLSWLELPLLVALLALLAAGLAMLLSALYVRYRDVGTIWAVVLQLLFFGSSVLLRDHRASPRRCSGDGGSTRWR